MERKKLPTGKCRIKFANDDGEVGIFTGYASVFNGNDQVGDTILPGAFKESLEEGMPKMFVNHDHHAIPVGDWTEMSEDDVGLRVKGKIDFNHRDGKSLHSAMIRGAMDGFSIGFVMTPGGSEEKEGGGRTIKNMRLLETSVVTFPMDEAARLTGVKRADLELLKSLSDCEHYLRDVGLFSKSMATAFVSHIKSLSGRDAGVQQGEADAKCLDENIGMLISKLAERKLR